MIRLITTINLNKRASLTRRHEKDLQYNITLNQLIAHYLPKSELEKKISEFSLTLP